MYKESVASKKKKRGRSPASNFFPRNPKSPNTKKTRQEDIVTALSPTTIAEKTERIAKKKKMSPDVQGRINLRILSYIVGEARPLITVESVHFINLLKEIDPRVEVFCVKTLKKLIAQKYFDFKEKLKKEFSVVNTVCLTADLWGAKNRSFMGVTAHWLVEEDSEIKRKSSAICCKRFAGISFISYCKSYFLVAY